MPTTPVVIDCDPGIDDAVALALAARSPELDIRAVTTTYGNAALPVTTRNAVAVLTLFDRPDIHVAPGADRPLERPLADSLTTHGPSGVGYAPVDTPAACDSNPLALLDVLAGTSDRITLVTMGPLTNLAHALGRDASLVRQKVVRHIGMFGTIEERGSADHLADFNAWSDPEAAAAVLSSSLATEMVGLDVTRRMMLAPVEVERIENAANEEVAWLGSALRYHVETHRRTRDIEGCIVNDTVPIAEVIDPGLLGFRVMRIGVDLDESDRRGHTVVRPDGSPTAVALEVAISRIRSLLVRVFGDRIDVPRLREDK